ALELKILELTVDIETDEGALDVPEFEQTVEEPDDSDEPFDLSAPEDTTYSAGSLGLQALNPEISVVGDFVSWFGDADEGHRHWSSDLRVLGVHFESYLDPYSKLKATIPVTNDWAKLGE